MAEQDPCRPGHLDLILGVLIIVITSSSIGLGTNYFSERPLPLLRKLPLFKAGDLSLGQVRLRVELGEAVVLDARRPNEYTAGHLPGAKHLEFANFETRYGELADSLQGRPLIVYCSNPHCPLADRLKLKLERESHDPVYLFRGGYSAWVADGLPIEKGAP